MSRTEMGNMLRFSRADRSILAEWWWTVDHLLLASIVGLSLAGFVFSMAASPSVAIKLGLSEFYFVQRQALFLLVGICLMISISLLSSQQLRRISLFALSVGFLLMIYALFYENEIKGSLRWIEILGFSLQPSEFVKPFFILLSAWLFAESIRCPNIPAIPLATVLLVIFILLLLWQPDVGQAVLIFIVWGALFFIAGMRIMWMVVFAGLCVIGAMSIYLFIPHVTARVDHFLDPSSGDSYQIDKALESIIRGSWFGRGLGEGKVKHVLPDAHTDFIFAATTEEFGIVVCLALLCVFAFIVLRVLFLATRQRDTFARFAIAGLIIMFGLQSCINMGVNLALLPIKGMTLPFISAGGSSMISNFMTMGIILGLIRQSVNNDEYFFDSAIDKTTVEDKDQDGTDEG